jgi:hypothetical protein
MSRVPAAGDHADVGPQHVLEHHRMLEGDRRRRTAAEDRLLGEHLVERRRTPRPLPDAAIGDVVRHAADPAEFGVVEQRRLVAKQRLHRRRRGEHREREAVGRSLVVDLVCGIERTRARQVRGDGRRLARNEAAVVARQHAHICVVSAAGREARDQGDGLALVEIRDRIRLGGRRCGEET